MSFLPRSTKNKDRQYNEKMKTPTDRENKNKSSHRNKFNESKNNKTPRNFNTSDNNYSKTGRKSYRSTGYVNKSKSKSKSKSKPKSKMAAVVYQGKGIDLNMVCGSSHPKNKFAQSAVSFNDAKKIIPDECNTFSIKLGNNKNTNAEYNKNNDNKNSNIDHNCNYQTITKNIVENNKPKEEYFNKNNLNKFLNANSYFPKENQKMSYKINDNNTLHQKDFYNNQNEINPILKSNNTQNDNISSIENIIPNENILHTEESKENQIQNPNTINNLKKIKENTNSLNEKLISKSLISTNINKYSNKNNNYNNFSKSQNNYIKSYKEITNNRNSNHTNYINDKLKNIMDNFEKSDRSQKNSRRNNILTISQRYRPVNNNLFESYNFNKISNYKIGIKKSIFKNIEVNEGLSHNKYDNIINNFSTKNWEYKSKMNYYNITANNYFKISNSSRLDELLKKVPRHDSKNSYRNSFEVMSSLAKIKKNKSNANIKMPIHNQIQENNKQLFEEKFSLMPANGFINRKINKLIIEKLN